MPVHEGRKTLDRAERVKVYHGDPIHEEGCLVVTDWGDDITEILEKYGYEVRIYRKHVFYLPEEITNVDITYDEYLENKNFMEKYFKYNSIVIQAIKHVESTKTPARRYLNRLKKY